MAIKKIFLIIFTVSVFSYAQTEVTISARNMSVVSTYNDVSGFLKSINSIEPRAKNFCTNLLNSQTKLLKETDSWKMYSLYEAFQTSGMMADELVRVPTVTELSGSIPQYTKYGIAKTYDKTPKTDEISKLSNSTILVADKDTQCGPDLLSVRKGAYFVKCGEYLIGSGLIHQKELQKYVCKNVRVLKINWE